MKARILGVTAIAAALVAIGGPAHADLNGGSGNETDGGYGVGVSRVVVTGDVDPGLRASVASPPPVCYWAPIGGLGWDVDASDPAAVQKYWDEEMRPYLTGHAAEGALAIDYDRFAAAVAAVAAGQSITFYHLVVDDAQRPDGDGYQQAAALDKLGCGSGTAPGREGPVLRTIDWFVTGQQPDPVVDPETLAQYAYEVMDLVDPTLAWNPRLGDLGGATLVNLTTWLWVTDEEAVGERSVTATTGPVSATVTASTDGLSATSPAGTTTCTAAEARRSYAAGVSEAQACTLTFTRASRGYAEGFPVEGSTVWQATWTSNTGQGGTLENKSEGATTYIPVAESQALVDSVD